MYIESLDIDKDTPYVVIWASRFGISGTEPTYHIDLVLVACDDLVGAIAGSWRPTDAAVACARVVAVPVELLAQVELGSIWFQGRFLGLAPFDSLDLRIDPARNPATAVASDARNDDLSFVIPRRVYALGSPGLRTTLTSISDVDGRRLALFHPVPLLQGLYGGSGPLYALLSSGVIDHFDQGVFSPAATSVEGKTLKLELRKGLSAKDDWVRAATWHAYPAALKSAAAIFKLIPQEREGKPSGYAWVDVPRIPDLRIKARGIPLPGTEDGQQRFLVLGIDQVSYSLPYDTVIINGRGKARSYEIKGALINAPTARTLHRQRHIADDMRILKPGGPKTAEQTTGPRMQRIVLDVGAKLAPDPSAPETIIPVTTLPLPGDPALEGMVGPGIPVGARGAPNLRLAGSFFLSANDDGSESSVQDLAHVIDAVVKVAQDIGARLSFLTLTGVTNYRLGQGVVGEFPCDEGYSPLTRFAWLRRLPRVPRRVLVAELEYEKRFFYILDSEKRSEQIAIGILNKRENHDRLSGEGLGALLKAAVRLRAVWHGLNGKGYRVQKLLHAPTDSIGTRLTRVMLDPDHSRVSSPAPEEIPCRPSARSAQERDRPIAGSP